MGVLTTKPLAAGAVTAATAHDSLAAKVKTAIVDLLLLLPVTMQRPAAAVVRAAWAGFRRA